MDQFTMTLITVAIIVAIPIMIFLIGFCGAAVMYESIFGKRFEIYDTPLLPDANDYPELVSEPVSFDSEKKYKYTGCYYRDKKYKQFKGLVVFSHGIFDGHLSYLPQIAYFAARGYKVFGFDNTGSHLSGGKSIRGLPQSAADLNMALKYLSAENDLPLLLFGHSWGGYAVSAVSCCGEHNIKGIFVQSGFNRSLDMLLEEGSRMYGAYVRAMAVYIKIYERFKFGKRAAYTAAKGAQLATGRGTKMLIMHSTDDDTISLKNSVLSNVVKNDNITFLALKNKGHQSLNSDASIKYRRQLDIQFIEEYHGSGTRRQRVMFYAEHGDKKLYHELDYKLMSKVAEFFDEVIIK
ncbi:MAG: alpha/beta hydrolase [Eubacterium sp.]|nr:alpha/beta hydrolase [Eubacterium sp.]